MSDATQVPAANVAPTATPNATPAPAVDAAPPANPQSWMSGLKDDIKGYVQNKGWTEPTQILESYQNLEKLVGAHDQLVKVPLKDDDAEGWGKVYAKLGRPEKPDGYAIPVPEKGGDPEFAKWAQEQFHALGLTKKQGESLVAKWNELNGAKFKQFEEKVKAEGEASQAALKKEWGQAYEQNLTIVEMAAEKFGMTEKHLLALREAMGPAEAHKFLFNIGAKLGEDKFVSGDGRVTTFGNMTPEAAKSRIAALGKDQEFMKRYLAGDVNAQEEMNKLHRFLVSA